MSYVDWNDRMLVHIPEIDEQHKELVSMINRLHESLLAGEGNRSVKSAISFLMQYVLIHFSAEEHLMRDNAFPDYKEHKRRHDEYVERLKGFITKYKSNTPLLAREMLLFLGDWARNHISGVDMDYAPYIQKKLNITVADKSRNMHKDPL